MTLFKTVEEKEQQCLRILDKLGAKYKDCFTPEIMSSETYYMTQKEQTIYHFVHQRLMSLGEELRIAARNRLILKRKARKTS